ncbi:putative sugar phosphate/phosphate translocator [Tetrabaena socialis]|uniref:Putative sugar phosphate/phosphate translocator n=1 Tax=Tetrabaena socialis TaxID=47790 RepID=A0A2J8AA59_9CHLO|nr:putative sugar phosphate/phosphate translocator [Tetrabaena socialis]|eukprot:PNH09408.1 putative sugar phosphate/phosphate translocator [Tetrabaena socialis]
MAMNEQEKHTNREFYIQGAITYGYISLWVFLSAIVIMLNKYVLAYAAFPFPIALTLTHMAFCSGLAFLLIKAGLVEAVHMDTPTYIKTIVPIAALFSGTLWLGNAAYLYLSVAFIQMLKATMPVTVFTVGVFMGTEKYSGMYALNMVVVAIGVATASYGELNFNLVGVLFQGGSIVTESFRLCLIQLLLQARGIKLNPVTTLYYIAPACFGFLCFPFTFIELPKMLNPETEWRIPGGWLLLSAFTAFALNMSVFMLIGRSSALTMNVAGVIKDWLLILLSVMLYRSPVATLQLCGYGVAFAGVCWYNYQKLQGVRAPAPSRSSSDPEKTSLLHEKSQSA